MLKYWRTSAIEEKFIVRVRGYIIIGRNAIFNWSRSLYFLGLVIRRRTIRFNHSGTSLAASKLVNLNVNEIIHRRGSVDEL